MPAASAEGRGAPAIALALLLMWLLLAGPAGSAGAAGTPVHLPAMNAFPSVPVIVIDPGHGGPDSGAVNCRLRFAGRRCMEEKDVTLDISLVAARLLRAQGFQVTLTRTSDQAVNHPARNIATWNKHHGHYHFGVDGKIDIDDELQARTNVADCNHKYGCPRGAPVYADAFVSVHENSCGPGCGASGSMSFFWHRQGSRRLARLIVGAVVSRIGLPGRGVHEAGFYVLRRSEMPAALLESAFLSSMHDARLLRRASFRRKIASGIATGIERFFRRP